MSASSAGADACSPGPIAVATDVGAWRVLRPVLRELHRRGRPFRVMLTEPAASIARAEGLGATDEGLRARDEGRGPRHEADRPACVPIVTLAGPDPEARAAEVLAARPAGLLLGTSAQPVVERALTRRVRQQLRGASPGAVPMLGVLDAMLFVERRFGANLEELPDRVACPDGATAERLRRAGASADALVVTGNPTLEEIGLSRPCATPPVAPDRPTDVLFVSSPVSSMRLRGVAFAIDERESLADLLAALAALRERSPAGFRVRVRLHPVQRAEGLPPAPPGIVLEPDDDPDRLRSCARARVVVGLSSTLLGEARLLPRTAVAYLPGPFWEQERVFGPEYGVRLAASRLALRSALAEALTEPPLPPPLAGHLGAARRIADLFERLGRPDVPVV